VRPVRENRCSRVFSGLTGYPAGGRYVWKCQHLIYQETLEKRNKLMKILATLSVALFMAFAFGAPAHAGDGLDCFGESWVSTESSWIGTNYNNCMDRKRSG
ncbi:MAG: hypothetical protein V6Z81_09350, partial [Parvularculales bacterium]